MPLRYHLRLISARIMPWLPRAIKRLTVFHFPVKLNCRIVNPMEQRGALPKSLGDAKASGGCSQRFADCSGGFCVCLGGKVGISARRNSERGESRGSSLGCAGLEPFLSYAENAAGSRDPRTVRNPSAELTLAQLAVLLRLLINQRQICSCPAPRGEQLCRAERCGGARGEKSSPPAAAGAGSRWVLRPGQGCPRGQSQLPPQRAPGRGRNDSIPAPKSQKNTQCVSA